jgi:hypothetical protein
MEKQLTAVEWLFCQSLELTLQLSKRRISHRTWELEMVKISEQAKEMEKEQNKLWWSKGWHEGHMSTLQENTETFKSE